MADCVTRWLSLADHHKRNCTLGWGPNEAGEHGRWGAVAIGAYVIASIAGAPLMHVFSLRETGNRYRFFGSEPKYPRMPAHQERDAYLKECAAGFARDMESVVRRDPFQWYNFFPFWDDDLPKPPAMPDGKPALEHV